MSATNRGADRRVDDDYETPAWCTRLIVPHLGLEPGSVVLDPCCGRGKILDVVEESWGGKTLGIEIDVVRARESRRAAREVRSTANADALAMPWTKRRMRGGGTAGIFDEEVTHVVLNPPYSLAMEFVTKALREVTGPRVVAALLRLPWLASAERADFHRANPSRVHVLSSRPEFAASLKCGDDPPCGWKEYRRIEDARPKACPSCGGRIKCNTSDAADYCWMVWRADVARGEWLILPPKPRDA